jgi:hypothetical protein
MYIYIDRAQSVKDVCLEGDHERVKMSCECVYPEDGHGRVKPSCEGVCPEDGHGRVK